MPISHVQSHYIREFLFNFVRPTTIKTILDELEEQEDQARAMKLQPDTVDIQRTIQDVKKVLARHG